MTALQPEVAALVTRQSEQRLAEGIAAEARHQMDPAEAPFETAFAQMACDHPEKCTCEPAGIPGFLAHLSGGDLPADAVREERCIRQPIGCGQPLITADGTTRVFWNETEAAAYQREWQITGLCPDCQDRLTDDEDGYLQ
ncbi:hypothetical protein [Streptomyces tendae]|uniref:hypothetical protein n=1 Tax=Streptomyces tendae TaxID=1932 RepID=UPI00341949CB